MPSVPNVIQKIYNSFNGVISNKIIKFELGELILCQIIKYGLGELTLSQLIKYEQGELTLSQIRKNGSRE